MSKKDILLTLYKMKFVLTSRPSIKTCRFPGTEFILTCYDNARTSFSLGKLLNGYIVHNEKDFNVFADIIFKEI